MMDLPVGKKVFRVCLLVSINQSERIKVTKVTNVTARLLRYCETTTLLRDHYSTAFRRNTRTWRTPDGRTDTARQHSPSLQLG